MYKIISREGDIYEVHFESTTGYDEVQKYKAPETDINKVLETAASHFGNQLATRQPRETKSYLEEKNTTVATDPIYLETTSSKK